MTITAIHESARIAEYDDTTDVLYGFGDWFYLHDKEIILQSSDKEFAFEKRNKTENDHRPVLLMKPFSMMRPNVTVFPRSSNEQGEHQPHNHKEKFEGCRLNKRGDIVEAICIVKPELITGENYSCREPDDSEALIEIRYVYEFLL